MKLINMLYHYFFDINIFMDIYLCNFIVTFYQYT